MSDVVNLIDYVSSKVSRHFSSCSSYSHEDLKQEVAAKVIELSDHEVPYIVTSAINAIKRYKHKNRPGISVPSGSLSYIKEHEIKVPKSACHIHEGYFAHHSCNNETINVVDMQEIISSDVIATMYFGYNKTYNEIRKETGKCLSQISTSINETRSKILKYMQK